MERAWANTSTRGSSSVRATSDGWPCVSTGSGAAAIPFANSGVATAWQSYLGNLTMVKGGGLEKFWTETEVYRCAGGSQQLVMARQVGIELQHCRR